LPEFHANGLSPRAYAGLWVLCRRASVSYDKARHHGCGVQDQGLREKHHARSLTFICTLIAASVGLAGTDPHDNWQIRPGVCRGRQAMEPMSENTVNAALRTMGYDTKVDTADTAFAPWRVAR
jgi:hypothetical protein